MHTKKNEELTMWNNEHKYEKSKQGCKEEIQ